PGNGPVTVQYLLRAVRIGVLTTMLVLLALLAFPLLPGHRPLQVVPYYAIIAVASVGAIVVARLPWRRLFQQGVGQRTLIGWSVFDIALITLAVVFSGKGA